MGAEHVAEAVHQLEGLARRGRHPDDVAARAGMIAAEWWFTRGDPSPDTLVLLVQELRRWCAVASSHHAARWDALHRAGRPEQAEEARRWAEALDHANRALHLYD